VRANKFKVIMPTLQSIKFRVKMAALRPAIDQAQRDHDNPAIKFAVITQTFKLIKIKVIALTTHLQAIKFQKLYHAVHCNQSSSAGCNTAPNNQ
jgi:hypothetical protein